ncbi:UNKNOWN [Stylonychia lemnae]|uniref:Transmembrane protein n=1 Tax=Stylonychia lemnae TaxID=5949 RepID=A0A078B583_STYLE|nr:UNKNOWN [Stylonychia lemnae]|eukprot:CDW88698.1 UNKNOWN [Stylonychia lemnae]
MFQYLTLRLKVLLYKVHKVDQIFQTQTKLLAHLQKHFKLYQKPATFQFKTLLIIQKLLFTKFIRAQQNSPTLRYLTTLQQIVNSSISRGINLQQNGLAFSIADSFLKITNSSIIDLSSNLGGAIYSIDPINSLKRSMIEIQNSSFNYCSAKLNGGVIFTSNADIDISLSYFKQNSAIISGGAIFTACSILNEQGCESQLINNSFVGNSVGTSGGAIYYDLYRPKMIKSNLFQQNMAIYGPNIASFPVKLQNQNERQDEAFQFASGIEIENLMIYNLYDQDDQQYILDGNSYCNIGSYDILVSIQGRQKVQAFEGSCSFSGITIIAMPSYESQIYIESDAIDKQKLQKIDLIENQKLKESINFRKCNIGEVNQNQKCIKCPQGTFSFDISKKICGKCLENSQCLGGNQVVIDEQYWRSSNQSEQIYKCLHSKSCLGGINSECAEGYYGKLCSICKLDENGKRYASSVLKDPRRNKPQTVLLRILVGYFQVIMICKDFEMQWPDNVELMLSYFSIFSSSQKNLFSIDCALTESGYLGDDIFKSKLLLFGLLPVILSIFSAFLWTTLKLICNKCFKDVKIIPKIQLTSFAIILLLYPTVISVCFQIFQCYQYEDGNSYVQSYMNLQCWGMQHKQISLLIGLPFLALWALIFPGIILYKLKGISDNLNSPENLQLYGIFYVGLNDNAYYWEIIVVNFKKLLFILVSTFVPQSSQIFKALIGIIPLIFQAQLTKKLKPYIDPRFNRLDFHATYASALTLYGGLFFINSDVQKNAHFLTVLFIVILLYNIYFFCFWILLFLQNLLRIYGKYLKKLNVKIFKNLKTIEDFESSSSFRYTSKQSNIMSQRKLIPKKQASDITLDNTKFNQQSTFRIIFKQTKKVPSLNQSQIGEINDYSINNIPEEFRSPRKKSVLKNKKVMNKKKRIAGKNTKIFQSAL